MSEFIQLKIGEVMKIDISMSAKALFIYLLSKANYKDTRDMKRGSLCESYETMSGKCGCAPSTVFRMIRTLCNANLIEFSGRFASANVIHIKDYDKYIYVPAKRKETAEKEKPGTYDEGWS